MPCSSTTLGIRSSRTTSSHRLLGGGGSLPATAASVLQQYFAPRAEAVSSVLNLPLGTDLNPALVAAPCRALREVGVAVVAQTSNPPMLADAGTSTLLARTANPPMVTDAGTSTLLAHTAPLAMLADAGTSTLLALTALPPMVTDAGTSTLLALAALPPVVTDASTSTLLAMVLAVFHEDRCWHLHTPCTYCAAAHACRGLAPPHSLQRSFRFP